MLPVLLLSHCVNKDVLYLHSRSEGDLILDSGVSPFLSPPPSPSTSIKGGVCPSERRGLYGIMAVPFWYKASVGVEYGYMMSGWPRPISRYQFRKRIIPEKERNKTWHNCRLGGVLFHKDWFYSLESSEKQSEKGIDLACVCCACCLWITTYQ